MGDLSENPLSNMNPISQYNELKDNINQLKENVTKIVKIIKPLIGEGLAAPCDMSKKLSNIMCSVSDNLNNGLDKLSDMDDINIESLIPSLNMNIFEAPLNIAKKRNPSLIKRLINDCETNILQLEKDKIRIEKKINDPKFYDTDNIIIAKKTTKRHAEIIKSIETEEKSWSLLLVELDAS